MIAAQKYFKQNLQPTEIPSQKENEFTKCHYVKKKQFETKRKIKTLLSQMKTKHKNNTQQKRKKLEKFFLHFYLIISFLQKKTYFRCFILNDPIKNSMNIQ